MDEKQSARYLLAIREHWIYVAAATVLAIAAAATYAVLADERYEATADVLVSPVSSDTLVGLPVIRESLFGRPVVTVARLTKSPQVASRVRKSLRLSSAPSAVSELITVTPQPQSDIVSITATSGSPEAAAGIANAFARALVAERTERFQQQLRTVINSLSSRLDAIDTRLGSSEAATLANRLADYRALSGNRDPTLEIVSPAVPPSTPVWPRPLLSIAVAAVIGLLLGAGIAVGLEIANPIVMRAESAVEQGGPPILTRMPQLTDDDIRAALSDPNDVPPETRTPIRMLWANLGSLPGSQARTLLITSAGDGDGSLGVAAVLATLMSRAGMRVMLIDADLERSPLAALVDGNVASVSSFRHVLAAEDAPVSPSTGPLVPTRLQVLLGNPEDRDMTTWLPPDRLSELVAHLKRQVDALVISAPPPPAADTTVLADLADAVIVTVALGHTRRDELTGLRQALAERGVIPAGLVVLDRPSLSARIARVRTMSTRWSPS